MMNWTLIGKVALQAVVTIVTAIATQLDKKEE
jgi:hypothetical protein